ncbi:ATP-binding cassette domain-containing protein [Enterococcus rivorum]|uniref:Multidrug ABC transporter n=1 Tax=Enterococcus rivorum TaxID=762845 RepID=A0A1E5KXU0_9ENTE|nr:ABC transporter ATP-binding protein [Enterococcus rivorum]MBP2099648.1 ABC-2 type transport system ATP-binding protein [Enterococcus rivorum]OEH82676.1 multidrug ABC transporter [Enterococcus rivorum]
MRLENVSKKIEQHSILESISITFNKHEITGLIGRNGSGKTTLFRTIASHYELDTGQIFVEDLDIQKHLLLKQNIFYIDEQYNFFSSYSLKAIQLFYENAYLGFDKNKFISLLTEHGLDLRYKYRSMSKGMQGLFKMILAVCSNADFVLLDEPFDGLDIIIKKKVIGLLLDDVAEKNRSYVISSHNLNELESIIDRALILKEHRIQYDYHLEDLREQARKIQMVFPTKKVPTLVKENSKLLHFQGRVVTAIFESYTPDLEESIKQLQPILFEELPLTLEDLFEVNLSKETTDYFIQGDQRWINN